MTRWHVIATRPQQEGRAVENLARQPEVVAETYWPRFLKLGKVRSLFPSYLFVRISTESPRITTIRGTYGVRDIVRIGPDPATVSQGEIDELRDRESPSGMVRLCQFNRGERVLWGVLAGTFEEMVDDERCAVLFQLLGRQQRKIMPMSELRSVV